MIQTVDNYQNLPIKIFGYKIDRDKFLKENKYYSLSSKVVKEINITLKEYHQKTKNNTFFSFFKDEDKKASKNEDDLIISIKKIDDTYIAQTGNYIGKFVWDGLEIDIKSRFETMFLERMLNFANDVFLDDVSISATETKDSLDISKFIIYYMFIQRVEKAFLLGLPKAYRSINHHDMKLKGKIDINRFIKNDIPFRGKISSTSREQREIQEVIDVLHKAVQIIEKNGFSTKNISHIKAHLKQHRSNRYVSNETINKAMMSKALQNPIFSPYKKVLEYVSSVKLKYTTSAE
jgi:5-methylcytosine-specific restriction endonuclease McrBC regulatory subunit McrC